MREIKFRAVSVNSGEIVYGGYVTDGKDYHAIIYPCIDDDAMNSKHINIRTLGQFTGAFDVNINEMYTGDKVRVDGLGVCTVDICPLYGVVFVDSKGQECPMIESMAENDSFELIEITKG